MRFDLNNGLTLKKLETRAGKAVFELVDKNRDHLRQWLPWVDSTKKEEDSLAFIESTLQQFERNKSLQCGIWFKGELAGIVGQHRVDWPNKWSSLGYWLAQEFEGKGIMTKACKGMIHHSFEAQKLNRVEIAVAVDNNKSRAVPERLGFKMEGTLRQKEWLYDRYVDHAVYSLLKSEWKGNAV
ncbi:MAG: GNAT family protein [Bacteriovoracaceae bacterium]